MMPPVERVPGMSELRNNEETVIGLMPSAGIKHLLGDNLPDPESYYSRAILNGAKELSPFSVRHLGDEAAYSLDPEGHVLVFAKGNKP